MDTPRRAAGVAGEPLLEKLCIVAYPPTPTLPAELDEHDPPPKCVELRLDPLVGSPREIPQWLPKLIGELAESGRRIVLTLRDHSEGGLYRGSPRDKLEILSQLASPHRVWLVDLEARYPLLGEAVDVLGSQGVGVLVSMHRERETMTLPEILGVSTEIMGEYDGVLVKIVHRCDGLASEAACLAAIRAVEGRLTCFPAWGPCRVARIVGPLLGAPLTYASLGEPVVPGQPSYWEVLSVWRGIAVL